MGAFEVIRRHVKHTNYFETGDKSKAFDHGTASLNEVSPHKCDTGKQVEISRSIGQSIKKGDSYSAS